MAIPNPNIPNSPSLAEARRKAAENISKKMGEEIKAKVVEPKSKPLVTQQLPNGSVKYRDIVPSTISTSNGCWDFPVNVHEKEEWHSDLVTNFVKPKEHYRYSPAFFKMALCLDQGMKVYLHGPSGTGKDTAAMQWAALVNMPVVRITGYQGMVEEMLLGSQILEKGAVVWKSGILEPFIEHGGLIILSEPSTLPAGVMFALQEALEDGGYFNMIDHPDPSRRKLKVNENTRWVFTSNTRGVGDNAMKYTATGVLDASTLNRIDCFIEYPGLTETEEYVLLQDMFPNVENKFLSKVTYLGGLIKTSSEKGDIEFDWSLRNAIPFIKMSKLYGSPKQGFYSTFANRLSDTELELVKKFWDTVDFGDGERL